MPAHARAVAEIVAIVGLVLLIVWIAKPLGRSDFDLSLRVLFVAWIVGSPWLHGDSRERLGLRMDTFWNALARVLPISLAAAGLSIVAGLWLASIDPPEHAAAELLYYFAWATAQQYALQSVILLRLEDAGLGGRAPLAAAALFSLVHAPNPGLIVLTFLGALLWCSTFRRHPNLLAVALSHAVLAVVVSSTLPSSAGNYRIGPAYLSTR